ncbi:hypothetical protein RYZ26_11100 [Terasakiella sp. A23]|uniref:hypothetical protein n=1 Tax=Terasakiella sp. FCG-A23 TaxID=3080561 RepID=UPI0029536ACD|nr:hypothetical protein [Terasakiella sp. A23]MDV7340143.1 hypothetical protein [Terasakiella sp. A23]
MVFFKKIQHLFIIWAAVTFISACAPHQQFRTEIEKICAYTKDENNCITSARQSHFPVEDNIKDGQYFLNFVELDDQGHLWDKEQLEKVIAHANNIAANEDIVIVTYVHGWKHSAQSKKDKPDTNIAYFRQTLRELSQVEFATRGKDARTIFGVYIGWRGGSVTLPGLKELTIWDRKSTAKEVGHGALTQVLSKLNHVKRVRQAIHGPTVDSRFVTIGHSLGGVALYSSVSQLLQNKFVETTDASVSDYVQGFGDLIVLINPAFEANQYSALKNLAGTRPTYLEGQRPVLAILTSEADWATKFIFPLGMTFSTAFENHRTTKDGYNQHAGDITTVGHFEGYITHRLKPLSDTPIDPEVATCDRAFGDSVKFMNNNLNAIKDNISSLATAWDKKTDKLQTLPFTETKLEPTENAVLRHPYLNIMVEEELMKGHNEICDPRVANFLKELIVLSTPKPKQKRKP